MKFEKMFPKKEIRRGCSRWLAVRRPFLGSLLGLICAIVYIYIADPTGFNNLIQYWIN